MNRTGGGSRGRFQDFAQRVFFLFVVRPFLVLFIGLKVHGRENLPVSGAFVLVANHTSHLDTVSLLALFPLSRLREIRPVAAADYFERNRFISTLTRTFFNTLPIVRRREEIKPENDPRQEMLAALDAGDSLILFPEGTRSATPDEIGRFKSGIAHLIVQRPNLRVVPAYLVNMGRSLPKGTWIPVPFFCQVRVGVPRTLAGEPADIVRQLENAVKELAG